MFTILVVGRNDGFGLNLAKRTAISLNYFASLCEDEDDEIIYVDCNTTEGEVTLTESIFDTLTPEARRRIKTYRVSGEQMYQAIGETPMPFSDELSRNVGIRRSNPKNPWILSTNCDLILIPINGSLHDILRNLKPQFYLCPRRGIPYEQWQMLNRMDIDSISKVCDRIAMSGMRFPPESVNPWQRFGSIGDFQLAPRSQWIEIGGCEEGMNLWGHSDVNNARRLSILNKNTRTPDLAGQILLYHLDHNIKKTVSANADVIPHNDPKRWVDDVTDYHSSNSPRWGLDGVELSSPSLLEAEDLMNDGKALLAHHKRSRATLPAIKLKLATSFSRLASSIFDRMKI